MKKIISLVLTFLLLASTIYVPTFAASAGSDVIEYAPDYTVVIDENFDKGTVGGSVSGITHKTYATATGSDPNYLSFTYENGIGGNTSKVGKLYDKASRAAKSEAVRYNEDGTEDINALYEKTSRNRDSYIFSDTIEGVKHVVTKFKYYHAEGAKKVSNGTVLDTLYVQHSIAKGLSSSTSPCIKITGDSAYINHRVITDDSDTGGVQNKLDYTLQTKKWYDVTFETVYDTVEKCATSTLTIDGHSVTGVIRKNNAIGYDEPNGVSMYIDYTRGGLFYIDDLQVIKYHKVPESFKTAVNDFTFDEVVAAGTANTQSEITEAWADGLMTTYSYGGTDYNVAWTSSDTNVISASGNTVSRKTEQQTVTLTAKISDPADSGIWATRKFEVVVAPKEASFDSDGDDLSFSVPVTVLYEENFNRGGIGDAVAGFSHLPIAGTAKNSSGSTIVDTNFANYLTFTYDYGIGTNTSGVGLFYDKGYTDAAISKLDSSGNADPNAVLVNTTTSGRNRDTMVTGNILTGARKVVTKFKYYHDVGAAKGSDAKDALAVMHAKASGTRSSTTPMLTISPTGAALNFRDDSNTTAPDAAKITGLQTKKWYDVTFETIYDPEAAKATSTVTIGDKTATSYIHMPTRPSYAANGYDEPSIVSFGCEYNHGGRFYLDDIKVVKYAVPSDNFEAAMNEFSFNDVVSGKTSNLQDSVCESWPAGLMTEYKRGNDTYQVEWTSSNPDAISTDGTVTRRNYAQSVALTAKVIDSADVYAERTFYVKVVPLEGATDAQVVSDYAETVIKESAYSSEVTEHSNRITKNITALPTKDKVAGVEILWAANPPGYIDVLTGEVTRPSFTEDDVEVTLTAVVSKNGETATKSITYTVAKNPDPNTVLSDALDNLTVTTEPLESITTNLTLPTEYNGAKITWDTSAHSQISENGVVTRGEEEVTADIIASITFDGVTRTKTFTLTVLPTVESMLKKDVDLIDKTGWDAKVSDFKVPLIGSKYGSVFTWSSDSDYVQVKEGGNIVVKRPLNADLDVILLVNAKIGRNEVNIPLNVTVLKQKGDQDTVDEIAAKINFDYIRGTNAAQDAVIKNLPLPTGFDEDKAATVEWTSSDESFVKINGEVIRPLPGEDDETITLTAIVKKNNAKSAPVTITFKVKALADETELLQDAYNSLVFSQISSESIDNITKNLYLPETGKYGAAITWVSNSKNIVVSGTEGIISQPAWGEPNENILLTATISFNGQTMEKSFSITIPESDTYVESEVKLNENFDSWTSVNKFGSLTSTGKWFEPLSTSGSKADVASNIGGASNTVIVLSNDKTKSPDYLEYNSKDVIESTEAGISMKFFVKEDFTGCATVIVYATGTDISIATAYINGADSSIDIVTANGTLTPFALKLEKGVFTKNVWNELRFDVNTKISRYNVYLNGSCITENGFVKNKETGEAFVSVNGIPYANKNANSKGIAGIRWLIDDGSIYFDDLNGSIYAVHTEDQKNVADIWEAEFLSTVNINYIDNSFKLPEMMLEKVNGITIRAKSNDGSVLNNSGIINMNYNNSVLEPTPFTLTVSFDNGTTIYKRYYTLMLYPKAVVDTSISDDEAVEKDLQTIVDFINSKYTINNLKGDINLSAANVLNGSTVTSKSSDTSIMTDDGKVTLRNTLQSVKFTVTVKKGAATKSQTFNITVGIKSASGGPGGPSSPGNNSKPPVSGENTNAQTGVDVGTPEDDNKENETQGTTSNFTDVEKDHWAYDQISYMVENKIMNGVGDGRIEPERTINREEFVKMLVMTLGLELKDAKADFTDVDANEWYAPYIATIKEKGLINGFEDGTFGIGQNISRQDLAVLIYRSTRLAAEEAAETFADDSEIADYAKDAVYTLRDLGIINGKGEGKFDPAASATRAETATMLYKAIKAGLFEL